MGRFYIRSFRKDLKPEGVNEAPVGLQSRGPTKPQRESSPSPATTKKAPNLGLFPFLSCVKNGHFRGLTTKLRQFEIAALGMIEPPFRFLDEYAFRQGHYNSREKPIFTRFNQIICF